MVGRLQHDGLWRAPSALLAALLRGPAVSARLLADADLDDEGGRAPGGCGVSYPI